MRIALAPLLLAATMASSVAACPVPATSVRADIYPTAKHLPANLLRFFVYFPRPMDRSDILDHVALVDDTGREVAGGFLENRYDLWSPDGMRLTVLLDPGRVKTGLAAHDAMGRALEEGGRYAFVVRATAEDAAGCVLGTETVQDFVAGPPDLEPPVPGTWVLHLPEAVTRAPLLVDLGNPHDHLSLVYRLRVLDAEGDAVPGRIDLDDGESLWRFTPEARWKDGPHQLVIDERLEDLAGNRPGALFDRPMGTPETPWERAIDWSPAQAMR